MRQNKYIGVMPKDENGVPISGDVAISEKIAPKTQIIGITAVQVNFAGIITPSWLRSRTANTGLITLGATNGVVSEGSNAQLLYPGDYYPIIVGPDTEIFAIASGVGQVLEVIPS